MFVKSRKIDTFGNICTFVRRRSKYMYCIHNKYWSLNKANIHIHIPIWVQLSAKNWLLFGLLRLKECSDFSVAKLISYIQLQCIGHKFWSVWFQTFVMFGFWIVKLITWIPLLLGQGATHPKGSCGETIAHTPARWKLLKCVVKTKTKTQLYKDKNTIIQRQGLNDTKTKRQKRKKNKLKKAITHLLPMGKVP